MKKRYEKNGILVPLYAHEMHRAKGSSVDKVGRMFCCNRKEGALCITKVPIIMVIQFTFGFFSTWPFLYTSIGLDGGFLNFCY